MREVFLVVLRLRPEEGLVSVADIAIEKQPAGAGQDELLGVRAMALWLWHPPPNDKLWRGSPHSASSADSWDLSGALSGRELFQDDDAI